MVSAAPLVKQPVPKPVGEQRVVFHSLTWQGFLAMRQSLSPLQDSGYEEEDQSPTFPQAPKSKLYEFLATARESEMRADRELRQWVRALQEK